MGQHHWNEQLFYISLLKHLHIATSFNSNSYFTHRGKPDRYPSIYYHPLEHQIIQFCGLWKIMPPHSPYGHSKPCCSIILVHCHFKGITTLHCHCSYSWIAVTHWPHVTTSKDFFFKGNVTGFAATQITSVHILTNTAQDNDHHQEDSNFFLSYACLLARYHIFSCQAPLLELQRAVL